MPTKLTERQLVVLSCHLLKDETRARQLIEDDAAWNKLCRQLLENGLLEWRKTYEHTGQQPAWGIASKTVVYTRVLTDAGHAALAEGASLTEGGST